MTPFEYFMFLLNSVLLGEEPWDVTRTRPQTVEDFILLLGTFVAFVAFILWCCFPVVPKEGSGGGSSGSGKPPRQYDPWAGFHVHGHGHGGWWGGRRRRGPSPAFWRYEPMPAS